MIKILLSAANPKRLPQVRPRVSVPLSTAPYSEALRRVDVETLFLRGRSPAAPSWGLLTAEVGGIHFMADRCGCSGGVEGLMPLR